MVQEHAPGADSRAIKLQAGITIAEIGKITEAVFDRHPDLEAHVESQIDKFGRLS